MTRSSAIRARSRRREGMILIVSLWLLAALSILALGLSYRLRLETRVTGFRLRRAQMLELARAAAALIEVDVENSPGDITHLGQPWARPLALRAADFGDVEPAILARYRVEGYAYDELGRVNVNSAGRQRLLGLDLFNDELASALIDWRDADDVAAPLGAENAYYRSLDPPRACKNRPLDSVYELLLVRYFTPELFFGLDGEIVKLHDGSFDWRPAAEGLRDLLTVYGAGSVNLNTAPRSVLLTIPGVTPEIADNIIYRRSGPDGLERTEDDVPFESFDDLRQVGGVTEFARNRISGACVLRSTFFNVRVQVTDMMSSDTLHLDAVIERADRGARIVSWRER